MVLSAFKINNQLGAVHTKLMKVMMTALILLVASMILYIRLLVLEIFIVHGIII